MALISIKKKTFNIFGQKLDTISCFEIWAKDSLIFSSNSRIFVTDIIGKCPVQRNRIQFII